MKVICIKNGDYNIKTITSKKELLALRIDLNIKILCFDGGLR